MGKQKRNVELNVITRRIDGLIFAGFATAIAAVVVLLGYAFLANIG